MGIEHSVIEAYGYSKADCIRGLQALLEYKYNADLYIADEKPYIIHQNKRYYVKFVCKTKEGPIRAFIDLND